MRTETDPKAEIHAIRTQVEAKPGILVTLFCLPADDTTLGHFLYPGFTLTKASAYSPRASEIVRA